MIKEANNVDFYTTGRQPSEQEFALISEWINKDKQKRSHKKQRQKHFASEYINDSKAGRSKHKQ